MHVNAIHHIDRNRGDHACGVREFALAICLRSELFIPKSRVAVLKMRSLYPTCTATSRASRSDTMPEFVGAAPYWDRKTHTQR